MIKIFDNKSWRDITREERYFCAELFQCLKNNLAPFLKILGIENENYDIGFEVCFYRDVLKYWKKSVKKEDFPQKRTFDLLLISDNELIIIEAKSYEGFATAELKDFEEDKKHIEKLYQLLGVTAPKVKIIALHASGYSPKDTTKNCFDKTITWTDVAKNYPCAKEILERADKTYRN